MTFVVDTSAPEPQPETGQAVGVDLGIAEFAVISDGRVAHPKLLERQARNLAR